MEYISFVTFGLTFDIGHTNRGEFSGIVFYPPIQEPMLCALGSIMMEVIS